MRSRIRRTASLLRRRTALRRHRRTAHIRSRGDGRELSRRVTSAARCENVTVASNKLRSPGDRRPRSRKIAARVAEGMSDDRSQGGRGTSPKGLWQPRPLTSRVRWRASVLVPPDKDAPSAKALGIQQPAANAGTQAGAAAKDTFLTKTQQFRSPLS